MTEVVKPNGTKIATKWAFINLGASIVLTYAFQFLDIDPNSAAKYLNYLPFIAFLLLTQKEYRDQLGGYLSFGQGFSSGFKYALFTGILLALFTYLYLSILSPGMWDKALDQARTEMESKGTLTDEQIEMGLSFMTVPLVSFISAISYTLVGTILSLIGAAILKKDAPPSFNFDDDVKVDPTV